MNFYAQNKIILIYQFGSISEVVKNYLQPKPQYMLFSYS